MMAISLTLDTLTALCWILFGTVAAISLGLLAVGQRERGLPLVAGSALLALSGGVGWALGSEAVAIGALAFADAMLLVGGHIYLGQQPVLRKILAWPVLALLAYGGASASGLAMAPLALALAVIPLALTHVGLLMPRLVEERWAAPRQLYALIHVVHAAYWMLAIMAALVGMQVSWLTMPAVLAAPVLMWLVAAVAWPQLVSQRLRARISRLSRFDALTGALNRRGLEEMALRELRRVRKHQGQFSLLLIDLDRFRTLNARYGHGAGDAALRACADAVRAVLARGMVFGRVSGEEFCVLAPGHAGHVREALVTDLRNALANLEIEYDDLLIRFSASVSSAQFGVDGTDFDALHRTATRRLTSEKKGPVAFADTGSQQAIAV
ncbi:GGDEF domain-containing protein [Chitinibacteraceae bacterium HSL-7]